MLTGRYVFYDFEATGLDPQTDHPIEVAAVEVLDGSIERRYQSLIALPAGVELSPRISELTGLCDDDLTDAPPKETVAAELAAFIGDAPRIAHNAPYDEGLLARLCNTADHSLSDTALDSLELSYFLRPDLSSHRLTALCKAHQLSQDRAHRALDDAEALAKLVVSMLEQARGRPRQLRALLMPLSRSFWPWRPILLSLLAGSTTPLPVATRADQNEPRPSTAVSSYPELDPDEVAAIFGSDEVCARDSDGKGPTLGQNIRPLAEVLDGYEPREQQKKMALHVAEALSLGKHAMIEAPTGVGKSLAYLIPMALYAKRGNLPVGISTNTKGLQGQLERKDLPTVSKVIGGDLRWQVVKGRNNYICSLRWRDLVQAIGARATENEQLALAYIGAIAEGPGHGEIAQARSMMLERLPELSGFLERVRGHDCGGQRAHDSCPSGRVLRGARNAHILILNHALLVSGSQLVPELDHLVIDEAHALEDRALSIFSSELDTRELARIARRVGSSLDLPGLSRSLARQLTPPDQPRRDPAAVALSRRAYGLQRALDNLRVVARRLLRQTPRPKNTQTSHDGRHVARQRERLVQNGYDSAAAAGISELSLSQLTDGGQKELDAALAQLENCLQELRMGLEEGLRQLERNARSQGARRRMLDRGLNDLRFAVFEQLFLLETLQNEPKRKEVRVLRVHEESERVALRVEPLHIGSELEERVLSRCRVAVLTSATLTSGDDGDFVAQRVGFGRQKERVLPILQLDSPFAVAESAVNLLVSDMPPITEPQNRCQAMADIVVDLARVLGGRMLVLFTAHARLTATDTLVRPRLAELGVRLLSQRQDGDVNQLLRTMRRDEGTVLFGLQSFWSGVDIAGRALSCVLVERIPFSSQHRPIIAARMAAHGEGYQGFDRYLLPAALLELRQGFGRLIRSTKDRGLIVLTHEELQQKKYYPRVERILPGERSETISRAELATAATEACQALGIETKSSSIAKP
jgi:ATP-dependent DNA helicase DinG